MILNRHDIICLIIENRRLKETQLQVLEQMERILGASVSTVGRCRGEEGVNRIADDLINKIPLFSKRDELLIKKNRKEYKEVQEELILKL
jgi:hypothetical protein